MSYFSQRSLFSSLRILIFVAALCVAACDLNSSDHSQQPKTPIVADGTPPFTPSNAQKDLAPGVINGAILASPYSANHLVSVPVTPNYGPIAGLVKPGTGEYVTGLLMSDGTIQMAGHFGGNGLQPLLPASSNVVFKDFAGGLHQIAALDSTGRVWTWAYETTVGTNSGISGSGQIDYNSTDPYQILTDNNGDPFDQVTSVAAGASFDAAIKQDGTVWMWGNLSGGPSDTVNTTTAVTRPTKIVFPVGVSIKKISLSIDYVLALATDGSVWSWGLGGSYAPSNLGRANVNGNTPAKITALPASITEITAGQGFNYALTSGGRLWGWGFNGRKLGIVIAANASADRPTPKDLTSLIGIPAGLTVATVAANDNTAHVILSDGSLWGWGDDAMGEVGDGQELNYLIENPYNHNFEAWDWGVNELIVNHAVHIATDVSNFKKIYTNTASVYYIYAVTDDGHVYSWGRNKTQSLLNGVISAAATYGHIGAAFPNSWDVLVPAKVNPFQITGQVQVTSPYCLEPGHQSIAPCTEWNNATNTIAPGF